MDWRFEWRQTWDDVWKPQFQESWARLLDADPRVHIYHLPELVKVWAETEGAMLQVMPAVGFAQDGKGNSVLLPWICLETKGRFLNRRVLASAGRAFFAYQDPLVDGADRIDWPAFWFAVRESTRDWDQALLHAVNPDYARGPLTEPCPESYPVLALTNFCNLDAVLAACSANHRGDFRRKMRRLEGQGTVSFWAASSTDLAEVLDDFHQNFLPAYDRIWGQRSSGNMLLRPGVKDFVEQTLNKGLINGWAHYSVLKVNGKPIAWHLGLIYRNQLYWWIPTHDTQWGGYSPGKLLLGKLMEHGLQQQWTHLHFQTGLHRYKTDWNPAFRAFRTVRWYAPNWKGAFTRGYDRVSRRLQGKPILEDE